MNKTSIANDGSTKKTFSVQYNIEFLTMHNVILVLGCSWLLRSNASLAMLLDIK